MNRKIVYLTLLLSFVLNKTYSQEQEPDKYTASNKGKIFFYWGGNRANFSNSDIRFKGKDYNFTLNEVVSRDKPKGYHIDYINPVRLTNPQTNARIGYFFTDNYNISIGLDHMKYVVIPNQQVDITGSINLPENQDGASFNGIYNNDEITLTEDFLQFEHTDGLNFINIEVGRIDDISSIFGIRNTDVFQVNITEGLGGGLLYPKTNAVLLGNERNDEFHLSGYGVSLKGGLNLTFLKYFFVQLELKGGYIDLDDIRTTRSSEDTASQDFLFLERIIALGGRFRI